MTYDKKRLDEAIKKIAASELKPSEIINGPSGAGRADRGALPRARRVLDTVNELLEQSREGAQPPEGARLRQRRLRLQSVPGLAAGPDGSELAVPAERVRAARRTRSQQLRRQLERRRRPIR